MADYINVGAKNAAGDRIPTKKALMEALKKSPAEVVFDPTSMFGRQQDIRGDEIPENSVLSVVGPDPEKNRRWFASVSSDGRNIKVT